MGRTSSSPRPSIRMPLLITFCRSALLAAYLNAVETCCSVGPPASAFTSAFITRLLITSVAIPRSCFFPILNTSRSSASASSSTCWSSPSGGSTSSVLLGFPTRFAQAAICLHMEEIAASPTRTASSICSSVKKLQKPSIMSTASSVPAMMRSSSLLCICCMLGFTTNSPAIIPTRTPATGFSRGMSEMASAAPAAVIASGSGLFLPSKLITHCSTCVSVDHPFSNMGRSGRSTSLEVNTSLSF
mmetsp:Transcript_23066/g.40949  ORF Transcript_23066/g.40949 Transcript_23066/m.40949 type:complete len:244 (+) Transcript_23066:1278-2009(+)